MIDYAKNYLAPFLAVSSMENQPFRPTLLDVPISYFEYDRQRDTFGNVPAQQTTLRRMGTTKFYRNPIEAIRVEADKSVQDAMKKQLPAFTPVALLYHRRRDTTFAQKIRQQWPLSMGDVDKKDNPGIDMAELKKHLARLPYVLICAYSVRGGLWFVVRLPEGQTPETLAAHFRYLQKLFSHKFGIKLDTTKGGNPTDLRFVSYDADPYVNENATIMNGVYTPPPPKPRTVDYSRSNGEDESQLLTRLVRFTEAAEEGQRHATLLKAAKLAGGFVAAGRMNESTALYALETVVSEWPTLSKSQKTIRDGIRYGLTAPIYPAPISEYKTKVLTAKPPIRGLAPSRVDILAPSIKTSPVDSVYSSPIFKPEDYKLERLIVEPCDTYPADWDTVPNSVISFIPPATRVDHPRAPLAFDAIEQLRRIQWIVIPPGVEEADHNPVLVDSPNRDELANILGIPSSQLPLYQLHRP